jgi:hypothetical protein
MRVPKIEYNNKLKQNKNKVDVMKLKNICVPEKEEKDFTDQKVLTKFIKGVEKLVRSSPEYKNYIAFLKNELDLTKCSFFRNIDINEIKKVGLEFHHYPFTLYDISYIVFNHILLNNNVRSMYISPFLIANEVTRLHYENLIGLVPLTKTIHELAHNGSIFIPLNYVNGNYSKFYEENQKYIPENMTNYIAILEKLDKTEYDFNILNKLNIFIDADGVKQVEVLPINISQIS